MRYSFLICLSLLFGIYKQNHLFGQVDSTNLPLFIINTNGKQIVDEPKINAELKIIYSEDKFNHAGDTANIYSGNIGIEIRGRYSATLPQKPYGLESRDSLGENLNIPLFHMPEENDWILLANYNDKTFMRNSLAFELFRKMGHYAPRTQFCEVIVNAGYQGIYVFTEKIKRDNGRVNISKLSANENAGDDLTGGYIIKVDYYDDSNSWISNYAPIGQPGKKVHFVYYYPKPDEITTGQKVYIKDFIDELEKTLYSPESDLHAISGYIDINSFIDYFILNELARNVDGYKKSSYFHKDLDSKDGLLHAGPVWDFDWAWKNINECYFRDTNGSGWAYRVHECNPWPAPPSWMLTLLRNYQFAQKVNERYFELRDTYLSEEYIFNYVDSVATLLDEAQNRHYRRWPILGINVGTPEVDKQPDTFAGEIEKFKYWISRRLNWLDANMPNFVVTGLEDQKLLNQPMLYPNPTASHLTFKSEIIIKTFAIFSTDGQSMILKDNNYSTSIIVDIEGLPAGLYLIKSSFVDGSQWIGKFVKE